MATKAKAKKVSKADKVLAFLRKSRQKNFTYGELAKKFNSAPMAIGQIMKSIGKHHGKAITRKVKAA